MRKMSDCTSPLGTVCKDPACPLHFGSSPSAIPDYAYNARVTRIIDGDTYDVEVDVGFRMVAKMPLRLAHVDAPEHNTPAGRRAIAAVTSLFGTLPASCVVRTYKPIDKYGRYLADVFLPIAGGDPMNLGDVLVEENLAQPYEGGKKA